MFDSFFDPENIKQGQHAWTQGFTDVRSGEQSLLDDHHGVALLCQPPRGSRASGASAYHTNGRAQPIAHELK